MLEDVVVIIPAYNEEGTIVGVIRGLKTQGFSKIIVIDDCSTDRTGPLARQEEALVVRHVVNRGLGGALGTGIRAALRHQAKIIVTFDADGQHDPGDLPALLKPILDDGADVVIGSRNCRPNEIPFSRRIAHQVANLVTFILFGARTTDSQSGLRAFSRPAAEKIQIGTAGMEVSSEIIAEIARSRLRRKEVPIKAIYTEYSLSKGQSFEVGLQTLAKLVLARMRKLW
jgi:glycosyltransferase involved in cell wall biosynthesis